MWVGARGHGAADGRKAGVVGRNRETRVGSGRGAEQAYLSDGGKCRGPSVERGEEAREREGGIIESVEVS